MTDFITWARFSKHEINLITVDRYMGKVLCAPGWLMIINFITVANDFANSAYMMVTVELPTAFKVYVSLE